jgi:Retrotransposon gag protein/Zinc knuckle
MGPVLTQQQIDRRFPPQTTTLSPEGDLSGTYVNHTLLAREFVKWEAQCQDPNNEKEPLIEKAATIFTEILKSYRTPRIITPEDAHDAVVKAEKPLKARLAGMEEDLAETRADLSRALKLAGGVSGGGSGQPKPEPFTGEREKLRSFLAQLRLQCALIADVQDKLRRAVSLLRGDALNQILPYIKNDKIEFSDLTNLIQVLEEVFDNLNQRRDAEAHLTRISQGDKDFSSYFAKFQRYAAEVDWNESAKLSALKSRLSSRLKQNLITVVDEPAGFKEWVELCQRLDNRRRAFLADKANQRAPATTQPQGKPAKSTTSAAATAAVKAPAPAQSTATGTHPGPMNLSANKQQLRNTERARRRRMGLCMYCGEAGHFARECPSRANIRAAAAALEAAQASTNESEN